MKFFFSGARLPDDPVLIRDLDSAAGRLFGKMQNLKVNDLPISDYSKRYLSDIISDLRVYLQRLTFLLASAIEHSPVIRDKLVVVDYGGGTGLLSLLAAELKLGMVTYNDIYNVSCDDAQAIAAALNLKADLYICGDIDEVVRVFAERGLCCHALVSYDVIEHIYDVPIFMDKLCQLKGAAMRIVMASTANPRNPVIARRLRRHHVDVEDRDRERQFGCKERDSLKAYFHVRKDIIADRAPHLSSAELEKLAKATRGMAVSDITRFVDGDTDGRLRRKSHVSSGHTNTCDPYTGNWAEHLLDLSRLLEVMDGHGFNARVMPGFYGSRRNIREPVRIALNHAMTLLGENGLCLSPFYVLVGERRTR